MGQDQEVCEGDHAGPALPNTFVVGFKDWRSAGHAKFMSDLLMDARPALRAWNSLPVATRASLAARWMNERIAQERSFLEWLARKEAAAKREIK
jgi:hypothetical protein